MQAEEEICIKTIALFVHGELTSKEFTDIFFSDTELFTDVFFSGTGKSILGDDLYYDIIDTNFEIKEQCISLKTKLSDFLKKKISADI